MKVQVLFILFVFFAKLMFAQGLTEKEYQKHLKKIRQSKEDRSVVASHDTIYNTGEAYAILKKVNAVSNDYSVKNLAGKELIYCRFNSYANPEYTGNIGSVEKKYYYELIFPATKKQCEIENKMYQALADFIVENNLLTGNDLNADAAGRLVTSYGNKFSAEKNKPVQTFYGDYEKKSYTIAERDKTKVISIKENTISQDNTVIGTFERGTNASGFVNYTFFKIYLPDGTLIASARYQSYGADEIEITTMKDNKIILLARPAYEIDKTIFQYLIDNIYL